LESSKATILKDIGNLWFDLISHLDKKMLADLKKSLADKTWVAEYLSSDNLVHYADGDQLVFHSIVDNATGT